MGPTAERYRATLGVEGRLFNNNNLVGSAALWRRYALCVPFYFFLVVCLHSK